MLSSESIPDSNLKYFRMIGICILRKYKVFLRWLLTFFSSKFNSYCITKSTFFFFG
ncbi:hypothetical protein LEP1GSC040_1731 [Leptospira santarosai str. 2000030832]|uniref:Uncharacterized protein n=1 Tax=Leptospira santarosai serovar Arenal str. MAVJ 401 TaxID=1049976 RepID=M6JSF7_9LEPT|nr:hypothetical protein LEP1GSC040_1731 [Leptospira santarosai str. 2000030832]EMN22538.1 hypothetical protein LEP1GSC063_2800 [Leptospira santarosai serovar Arenal str. MAVJ 401]